jgi:hypothetical protein
MDTVHMYRPGRIQTLHFSPLTLTDAALSGVVTPSGVIRISAAACMGIMQNNARAATTTIPSFIASPPVICGKG